MSRGVVLYMGLPRRLCLLAKTVRTVCRRWVVRIVLRGEIKKDEMNARDCGISSFFI